MRRRDPLAARAAIALLVIGAAGCGEKPAASPPPATIQNAVKESDLTSVRLTADAIRRLGIETVPVESSVVAPTRTLGGEVTVPPGRSLIVSAPVAGTVLEPGGPIPVAGARVSAGQPLMRLVALPPDRDLLRTQHDLTAAEARLRQARAEAERVASLYADKLVSARDQERAQADLVAAQSSRDAASAQQRLVTGGAGRDASGMTALVITAPAGGVVRSIGAAAGQSVAAGAALAEIVRLDRLWVRVPVYAGDAGAFVRTASASVERLGGGGAMLVAMPVAAPPSADPVAASVDLYYELAGGATLRPGERVGVTMTLVGGAARALVVPLAAVLRDMSGGSWVYERTDSVTFARRRVEVSRVIGGRAVLASGPKPGTLVVTAGAAELFGTEFGAGK